MSCAPRRLFLPVLVLASSFLGAAPSAGQNIVVNGEFATDLASWSVLTGAGVWDPLDRNGSPTSGSARLTASDIFAVLRQTCMPVVPGTTYDFGARVYLPSGQGSSGHSWVRVMWDSDCDPSGIVGLHQTSDFAALDTWQAVEFSQAAAPIDATFAHIDVAVIRVSGTFFGHVDGAFLRPSEPTPIVVTSLADSGPGTLREAIGIANSDGVPTTIDFDPGLAGGTISPLSQLPDLTEGGTTIDGDFGGDCNPDIAIDGSSTGPAGADGLALTSNGHIVRGLAFFDFSGDGLHIGGSGNVVECSYFGTNLALATGHGNGQLGITHVSGNDNRLGPGNVIAYNGGSGIQILESNNGGYPLFTALTADDTRRYPVIAFDDNCGFFASADAIVPTDGSGAPFTDEFGLRLTGELDLGASGDYTFSLPDLDDSARLLVDGGVALDVTGPGPHSTVVSGLSSGVHTLELDFGEACGPAHFSLTITGPGSASLSTGAAPPAGCGASLPGLCGELFQLRIPSERNTVTKSSIHGNSANGLTLTCGCSPLPNDSGDLDLGPNTVLNHPAIASFVPAGGGLYTISGTAPPDATVEIFLSDNDPSGYGEGQLFLGSGIADAGGLFSTTLPLDAGTTLLTATATDPLGNTSEFGPNFAPTAGLDRVVVSGLSGLPGTTVEIPVQVRDMGLTELGLDRPFGERIQGVVFKVLFAPAAITAASAARAGVLLGLTPLYELAPATASSISYLAAFDESTDLIPFTLDGADVVAALYLTLAADAPAGPLALALDAATTELANQAGTLSENQGNGRLTLADGQITVLSNAASGLYAAAVSSSAIQLTWGDPNQNETGFRLERSTDSASWSTVATLGADDTAYLDVTSLAPATLYYYRLVTLIPADSQRSNVAAASTFPAVAAKVCATQLSLDRAWARFPAVAWNGASWGVAWQERTGGAQDEIFFQRFDSTSLAPIGAPVNISQTDSSSQQPAVAWNGSQFGVAWFEDQRTEPGQLPTSLGYFALLNADGSVARRGVRVDARAQFAYSPSANFHPILVWDGTNWGFFTAEGTTPPFDEVVYRRLAANGDLVLGPVDVTATPGHFESEIDAAFSPALSEYGVAWIRSLDTTFEVYFQRVEESTGAALGAPALLGSFSGTDGTWGLSVTWNPLVAPGGAWGVSWAQSNPIGYTDLATYLRLVDATGTPLGAGPERLSNDADPVDSAYDFLPVVASLASGEFVVATESYDYLGGGSYEIAGLSADAAGTRSGARTFLTANDGRHSTWQRVAVDGNRFAVVWNDSAAGTLEAAGTVVDALGVPGPEVGLTAGHSPGNPANEFWIVPGGQQVAPLGAGFVALWTDTVSGTNLAYARTFDGTGATLANLLPLSSTTTGAAALAAVGDTFAVALQVAGGFAFSRYDAAGAVILPETVIAAGIGGALAMGFDGENYAVLGVGNGKLRFQRLAPDGTPVGAMQESLAAGVRGATPRLQWTGEGWAVLYLGTDRNLRHVLLNPDGTVRFGPTILTAPPPSGVSRNQFDMVWNGQVLGVAWQDSLGADPPSYDLYFTVLNRDGSTIVPAFAAVSGPGMDWRQRLYWANGAFHLVHLSGFAPGLREIEIQADGVVLPGERFWSNREGLSAVAWNGATLGISWLQLREIYFETSACVEDATAPPCPALAVSSLANQVHLSWPAVADPESGVWRYNLYRDSWLLAELFGSTLAWDDAGYRTGTTHTYELRAMNGAFQESEACPTLAFSTTAGDANGDGAVDAADIFYLVNFLLADGAPPAGDGDANGDGAVSVTDIFYLINYIFSGGPPPVPVTGSGFAAATAVRQPSALRFGVDPEPEMQREDRSLLAVGSATAAPGATVRIPIDFVERAGTPLGPERPAGDRVQALALAIRCSPCDGIAALTIEPAGSLAKNEPIFESRPGRPGHAALVSTYDEATTPLFHGLSTSERRQRVATLVVELTPSAAVGTTLDLRLDPGTTLLSNQAGTTHESVPNGWLELADGRLTIGAQPTLRER